MTERVVKTITVTPEQAAMCKNYCGDMGKHGFHSLLCPLSGVNHPSRPGNTVNVEEK
jgi:hypothetical protein